MSRMMVWVYGAMLVMTVGVYGLVAGIVKLDDAGLWLSRRPGTAQQAANMPAASAAGTLCSFIVFSP